ncbi:MAG TPA: 50S ribosomal protein L5 [Patescibacteria group bacterium]
MINLEKKYQTEIVPRLKEELGYTNVMSVPKFEKVVINVGVGKNSKDAGFIEMAEKNLTMLTGQKPIRTKAKKSISNFKIREGNIVGLKVTLRKKRMYDFLDKLVNITLPRIRDFRGLSSKSFDGHGNFNIGFKEQIAFPEMGAETIEKLHGLEVSVSTTAKNDQDAFELCRLAGFPFKKNN